MKIKTKLIITSVAGVFITMLVSIIIGRYLIQSRTQTQNTERLSNAFSSIEVRFLKSAQTLTDNYQGFSDSKEWNIFATMTKGKTSSKFRLSRNLTDWVRQFGRGYNMDFALENPDGNLHFRYSKAQKTISFGDNTFLEFNTVGGISINPIETPPREIPKVRDVPEGLLITLFEEKPHIILNAPLSVMKKDKKTKEEAPYLIGNFVFLNEIDLDLAQEGKYLGVFINLYDASGQMIAGELPFEHLNMETLEIKEERITRQAPDGELYDSILKPLMLNGMPIGYISVSIAQSITSQIIRENTLTLALFGVALLFIVGFATYWLVLRIVQPIAESSKVLNEIAQEGGDLTQRMNTSGNDEMSELSAAFNEFVSKVQHIIQEVKDSTSVLATSSDNLSSGTLQMSYTAESVSRAIVEEHKSIQQNSDTVGQMVDSLKMMFKKIEEIHKEATKAKEIALHGGGVVEKTSQTMDRIAENAKQIEGVVGVITEIANQTNLLSLNAAIEAAKAGDSGKGFAVVADEVRSLAEKSAQQVIEIRNLVEISKSSVQSGSKVILEIQEVFDDIQQEADQVLSNVNVVTEDITHQESSIQRVVTELEKITTLSKENSVGIEELSETLTATAKTTEDVSDLSDKIFQKVNEFEV